MSAARCAGVRAPTSRWTGAAVTGRCMSRIGILVVVVAVGRGGGGVRRPPSASDDAAGE